MAENQPSLWKRIIRHFRGPTFQDFMEDSANELKQKGIAMNCPQCGKVVPFSDRCINCGSPRHPPIDERV